MGKNKNATKALTQEEIWDDSALVQSWDEAVDEYKLYHSIQARGQNIEDVLREAELAEKAGDAQIPAMDIDHDHMQAEPELPKVTPEATQAAQQNVSQSTGEPVAQSENQKNGQPHTVASGPGIPQTALAQVQDEGLKNLMMSWYYAGYYTGLYEGQQRANNNQAKNS
ncbi:hypothetical protein FE257_009817 [Aspergillus nanangensis]|uniref:Survival Motor Neuron Gemin2-binding domain-containing protein n=1 Tax=Aspergillus nanangensis TaxID=2582783 RepID=A0AAD4CJB3_ASPNN|nr:hypothetical protein FE257_009817 [Aspergillus nanangensis]